MGLPEGGDHRAGAGGLGVGAGFLAVDPLDRLDLGAVAAEHLLHGQADLADRGLGASGVDGQGQEVACPARAVLQRLQGGLGGGRIALGLQAGQLLQLLGADRAVVDLQHRDVVGDLGLVAIDADHALAIGVDAGLGLGGGFLDAQLGDALLDSLGHAASGLDFLDVGQRLLGQVVGQALDVIAAAPGVGDAGRAALHLQEQLGVARDARREVGRQGQGLVQGVGVQALGLAVHGRHGFDAGARDVVEHVLGRQRPTAGLAVRTQRERAIVLRIELALHQAGPQQACGAHLRHFHEVVHADRPEERQARGELVDAHAGCDTGAGVFDAVGQGVGQLQVGRRSGLLHVIAADRDRVELGHVRRGEGEDVRDDPHRGRGRIDVGVPHHELFEDVVLDRPRELVGADALFLGRDDVERQDRQHRAVHGHRHAHLVERDPAKERAHVEDRVDGYARHADVALHPLVVAVIAPVSGEIERDRQAHLTRREVATVEGVGVFRRREACVLPHRPGVGDVHGRVGTADERRDTWEAAGEVEVGHVIGVESRGDRDTLGRVPGLAFRGGCGSDLGEVDGGEVGELAHGLKLPRRRRRSAPAPRPGSGCRGQAGGRRDRRRRRRSRRASQPPASCRRHWGRR